MLREAIAPAALEALVGMGAAIALGRAAGPLLFGVRPFDPLALGVAALLLVGLAALASDAPARRAARLDPVAALKED